MRSRRGTSRNDQASFREAGEVHDCIFNIILTLNSGWTYLDPNRPGRGLNCTKLAGSSRIDVTQYDCSGQIRFDRFEKANPLSGHDEFELSKSSHVTAWTCQAFDIAGTNWVRHLCEHYRDAACPVEQRIHRGSRGRQDYIRRECDQLRCALMKPVGVSRSPAGIYLHVAGILPPQIR